MIAVLVLSWVGTLGLMVVAILQRTPREVVLERLEGALTAQAAEESDRESGGSFAGRSLSERVLRPLLAWVAARAIRFFRPSEGTEELLAAAGNPLHINVVEFVGLKLIAGAFFLGLGAVLMAVAPPPLRHISPVLSLMLVAIGYMLPNVVMSRLGTARRLEMKLALPDMLDLITLSVEAGMGFDGSVGRAISNTTGPLSEELSRTLMEVSRGKPRLDAFRDLASRAKIEELALLVSTVHQSEQLGVSIGDALRELGDQLRIERSQRAEETIARLPIKMLFPLLFFIFPALFIVILGPAAVMLSTSSFMSGGVP